MNNIQLLPQQLELLIQSAFAGNLYSQDQLGNYFQEGFYGNLDTNFLGLIKEDAK